MPIYIAFLRAINLGPKRTFPKADIVAATEAAGGAHVATHGNTGNVRLTSSRRSTEAVRKTLEQAYAADRGFEVPTVVFTPQELVELTERGSALRAENVPGSRHYVTLFTTAPTADTAAAVEALRPDGERCVVVGRAAYALIDGDIHSAVITSRKEFTALGPGTSRSITVLRTICDKWCQGRGAVDAPFGDTVS